MEPDYNNDFNISYFEYYSLPAHERPQDFDFDTDSPDWNYIIHRKHPNNMDSLYNYSLYPMDTNYYDDTIIEGEYDDSPSAVSGYTRNMVKLILICIIFITAAIGNVTLTYVINVMNGRKTLRQKMLISVLAITSFIRIAVYFIRDIYMVTYQKQMQFNVVICKADAFLDNFTTAVFPYVLMFLVYDSSRFVCCSRSKTYRNSISLAIGGNGEGENNSSNNKSTTYTNQSKLINLVILIITFLSVITFPLIFSIVITIMTTTKPISGYGGGIKVNGSVCFLDIDFFDSYTPFKSYLIFHSPMWLIFIPLTLIALIYIILSLTACGKRCICWRRDSMALLTGGGGASCDHEVGGAYHHSSETGRNYMPLFIERKRIDKNWLLTIICLVVVYLLCYVPYHLSKLLFYYLDLPANKTSVIVIMIVFFLYNIPPAVIPIILAVIDLVIRHGYRQHLFCLRGNSVSKNKNHRRNAHGTNKTESGSNNTNTLESSSWKGSNSIVSNSTIYTNTNTNKSDHQATGGACGSRSSPNIEYTPIAIATVCSDYDHYSSHNDNDLVIRHDVDAEDPEEDEGIHDDERTRIILPQSPQSSNYSNDNSHDDGDEEVWSSTGSSNSCHSNTGGKGTSKTKEKMTNKKKRKNLGYHKNNSKSSSPIKKRSNTVIEDEDNKSDSDDTDSTPILITSL